MDQKSIISYALAKQLSSAHTLDSNYGGLELDDELREAIDAAVRPILERRLRGLEGGKMEDPCPWCGEKIDITGLTPMDSVEIECHGCEGTTEWDGYRLIKGV